jgi:hypothetical protein
METDIVAKTEQYTKLAYSNASYLNNLINENPGKNIIGFGINPKTREFTGPSEGEYIEVIPVLPEGIVGLTNETICKLNFLSNEIYDILDSSIYVFERNYMKNDKKIIEWNRKILEGLFPKEESKK